MVPQPTTLQRDPHNMKFSSNKNKKILTWYLHANLQTKFPWKHKLLYKFVPNFLSRRAFIVKFKYLYHHFRLLSFLITVLCWIECNLKIVMNGEMVTIGKRKLWPASKNCIHGILRCVFLVRTDVSEERIASIIRAGESRREYMSRCLQMYSHLERLLQIMERFS
jgi:hypothetical protein